MIPIHLLLLILCSWSTLWQCNYWYEWIYFHLFLLWVCVCVIWDDIFLWLLSRFSLTLNHLTMIWMDVDLCAYSTESLLSFLDMFSLRLFINFWIFLKEALFSRVVLGSEWSWTERIESSHIPFSFTLNIPPHNGTILQLMNLHWHIITIQISSFTLEVILVVTHCKAFERYITIA